MFLIRVRKLEILMINDKIRAFLKSFFGFAPKKCALHHKIFIIQEVILMFFLHFCPNNGVGRKNYLKLLNV